MKKIIIPVILSLVIFFSSCTDILQEHPKNFIARTNFYKTSTDAKKAIIGAYDALGISYGINYWLFLVLHTDIANGRGSQAPISVWDQILDQANIGRAGSIWTNFYLAINRANSVLDNVPGISMDEAVKNRILAEAHFIRAMCYFDLVRGFGAVPLKLKESTDLSSIGGPRVSVDKVYEQIIKDALLAENGLPSSLGGATGRASKWAAKMLLAEVYLTRGKWEKAAKEDKGIINSGKFLLIRVKKPNDFTKMFKSATNSEDIFSFHHSKNHGFSIVTFESRPNTPPYNYGSSGYFAWVPIHNSFIFTNWNKQDLRRQYNLYSKYIGPNGSLVPLPEPSPLFGKFRTNDQGIYTYSLPIFRYTETILNYAEAACMANGGPTRLALKRLNMIKRRAYGYDPLKPSPIDYPSGMSQKQFRDAVLRERAYSFILEGKRWWDLKRTHRVKEAMAAIGKTVIDARLLWPIPLQEIQNNPDISPEDQNPGY